MKTLPKVYVCLERLGNGPAIVRAIATTEDEAKRVCTGMDKEPKSGWMFYRVYVPKDRTEE